MKTKTSYAMLITMSEFLLQLSTNHVLVWFIWMLRSVLLWGFYRFMSLTKRSFMGDDYGDRWRCYRIHFRAEHVWNIKFEKPKKWSWVVEEGSGRPMNAKLDLKDGSKFFCGPGPLTGRRSDTFSWQTWSRWRVNNWNVQIWFLSVLFLATLMQLWSFKILLIMTYSFGSLLMIFQFGITKSVDTLITHDFFNCVHSLLKLV